MKKNKKDDHPGRQVHMMSDFGLFYLIIITFFAVPLVGAFVVVLIRGVADLRHLIIAGGAVLIVIALYLLVKALISAGSIISIRGYRKVRQDGLATNQDAKERSARGEPIQISVFNGLMTFTYGGAYLPGLPDIHRESSASSTSSDTLNTLNTSDTSDTTALLPHMPDDHSDLSHYSIVRQLRELSLLRKQDIISEDEFQIIKTRLIFDLRQAQTPGQALILGQAQIAEQGEIP